MTRLTMEQAVLRDFGYADSPAAAVTNRIRGYLNDRHRRILSHQGRESLRLESIPFTLTASTANYALELDATRIVKMRDTTNNQTLEERSLTWYRRVDPNVSSSGTQQYYIVLRQSPAARDISATGLGLWVVSTAAGDAQTVVVETIDAQGSVTNTTATVNGTTRVQIGTATNHLRLVQFAASAAATGVLELYDAATGGNRVSRIGRDRTTAQYVVVALWPTPAAADTINVDYIHHIRNFTQDYDEPQLPQDFHYLVMLGAKIDEARHHKQGDAAVRQWQDEYDKGLRDLDAWLIGADTLVIPGELALPRRSNLGSAFPPGVW